MPWDVWLVVYIDGGVEGSVFLLGRACLNAKDPPKALKVYFLHITSKLHLRSTQTQTFQSQG